VNEINRQVSRAKQRIFVGNFFRILTWGLFAGLFVAAIGVTLPKIWSISAAADPNWNLYWIVGGVCLGLVTTALLAWVNRYSQVAAAVEVDKRFGLKSPEGTFVQRVGTGRANREYSRGQSTDR